MLLFHSIYTPVSSAGVNPVPTPPRAAVFISSLQRLLQPPSRIQNSTLEILLIPLLPKSNRPPFRSDIIFHKASNHSEFLDRRGCGRYERERGAKKKEEGENTGSWKQRIVFVVLSQLHRVLVWGEHEDRLDPVDGGSLDSLSSGFGWMISKTQAASTTANSKQLLYSLPNRLPSIVSWKHSARVRKLSAGMFA